MQDEGNLIKIHKPPENPQGWWEKLTSFLSHFPKWLARAMGRVQGKTRDVETPTLRPARKLVSPPANGGAPLRIKVQPSTQDKRLAGGADGTSTSRPKGTGGNNGRVVVDTEVRKCNACSEELKEGEAKARCSRNSQHVIHSRCVIFMKHKCPYCGGRIAGYSRPAAGA